MPGYSIYDEDDQARTVRRVLEELEIDQKQFPPRALLGAISDAKNRMIVPDVFAVDYGYVPGRGGGQGL